MEPCQRYGGVTNGMQVGLSPRLRCLLLWGGLGLILLGLLVFLVVLLRVVALAHDAFSLKEVLEDTTHPHILTISAVT